MPRLPGDASLEHLKNQAKTLLAGARAGDPAALRWVRAHHPDPPAALKLADAQLVVARAYGFASWPKLHAHLDVTERFKRSPHAVGEAADPADEFLRLACLTYSQDDPARWAAAARMLAEAPELARASLHTAAAAGDVDAARVLLGAGDPANAHDSRSGRDAPQRGAVDALGGPYRWPPLLYLTYSRVPGGDPLAVARLLLAAGADPDAGFLWEGLVPPFTALTGAFGRGEGDPPPHREAVALARLLLEAGADPNDGQAVYNLHWHPDDAWLELLLEFGFGGGDGGVWHRRLGAAHASPRENAEDCLMWAALQGYAHRVGLLLAAGVDPDGRGTRHPILRGRSALEVALGHGHTETAAALRAAGAAEPELTDAERVEAAYMAADPTVTAPPPPGLIVRAAESGAAAAVALLLERGADVNAMPGRATALHEAAVRGDRPLVDILLAAGADPTIRDREFNADAAGWAAHAGHTDLAAHLKGTVPFT
jgi:ankyrin repeat protein